MMAAGPQFFTLDQDPRGLGLRCDEDGLFLAGEPLLVRSSRGQFQPKSHHALRKMLGTALDPAADLSSRIRSVEVIARSLNKGDLAHAMMAVVLMGIPETRANENFAKANFNSDEPRDDHGRWTSDGAGGARLITAQMDPFVEPLLDELVRPPVDTIDIVPPVMNYYGRDVPPPTNPYPKRPECVEEWDDAYKFCRKLRREGKLGKGDYAGFGRTFRQCLMGQVSEDCGGNPVSRIA